MWWPMNRIGPGMPGVALVLRDEFHAGTDAQILPRIDMQPPVIGDHPARFAQVVGEVLAVVQHRPRRPGVALVRAGQKGQPRPLLMAAGVEKAFRDLAPRSRTCPTSRRAETAVHRAI